MKLMTQEQWDEVQRLRDEGMSTQKIADIYGISRACVSDHTKKAFFRSQEKDWGTAQALRDAGWSPGAIAKELRVSKEEVCQHTHKPKPRKQYVNEWNINEPEFMKSADLI